MALVAAAPACSKKKVDPATGLSPGMTKAEVIGALGQPMEIKGAGNDKEIYIYRTKTELTHVFLVKGQIRSIEHVQRRPMLSN
jgi:outer membrane protein assembly factor BamE (lipoprotein component of BamABCDE complex)